MIQPSGIPGNPTGLVLSETPIQTRKIVAFPRHVEESQLEKSSAQDSCGLALSPFRSFVASPASPNTPTPVPPPRSGYNCESFLFAYCPYSYRFGVQLDPFRSILHLSAGALHQVFVFYTTPLTLLIRPTNRTLLLACFGF